MTTKTVIAPAIWVFPMMYHDYSPLNEREIDEYEAWMVDRGYVIGCSAEADGYYQGRYMKVREYTVSE